MQDSFLEGNEIIEKAIENYNADGSKENLDAVLGAIRDRMHADGHLIFPVTFDEVDKNRFAFKTLTLKDGKLWNAAFTSQEEFERGVPSEVISNFIDTSMRFCLESDEEGFILNPFGQSFQLSKEMIKSIFDADGDVEHIVPDVEITKELLEDGSFLKRVAEICGRNRTKLNMLKLARVLRDSWVWIPCNAVMSEADAKALEEMKNKAEENPDELTGETFTLREDMRMVPDILQNGDNFFFPVFSSTEEAGEYGSHFHFIEKHFLEAANLARNNDRDVAGIGINAFSAPFVVPIELFDLVASLESSIEE